MGIAALVLLGLSLVGAAENYAQTGSFFVTAKDLAKSQGGQTTTTSPTKTAPYKPTAVAVANNERLQMGHADHWELPLNITHDATINWAVDERECTRLCQKSRVWHGLANPRFPETTCHHKRCDPAVGVTQQPSAEKCPVACQIRRE